MKKRFSQEQIIGFLREADAGLPIKELWRKHGFSDASAQLIGRDDWIGCQATEKAGERKCPTQEVVGRAGP